MRRPVAVRSIIGTTTKGLSNHTKSCIADYTPRTSILHRRTNNVLSTEIADSIISLAPGANNCINEVMVSALTIRNDDWDKKRKAANEKLKNSVTIQVSSLFLMVILYERSLLNNSKLHLNGYRTKTLVSNFCSAIRQWHDNVCKVSRVDFAKSFFHMYKSW